MTNKFETVQGHAESVVLAFDLQRFNENPPAPPAPVPPAGDPVPPADPVPPKAPADPAPPAEPPAPKAPDSYADFKLPDGFSMDSEALAEFLPYAKQMGMSQEAAQQAISLHTKAISTIMGKVQTQRDEAYAGVMEDVKKDKDLGGKNFEENFGKINAVLSNFGGEGIAETFHAGIAQIAAHDPKQAKQMYATLHAIAKAASIDDSIILGMPRKAGSERFPGLPGSN